MCVNDWNEFARFLERRYTKNIDLRKMRLKKQDVKKVGLVMINLFVTDVFCSVHCCNPVINLI